MARSFNGSSDRIVLSAGGLGGRGAYSCAAIIRTGTSFASRCIFLPDTSSSQINEFQVRTGGLLSLYDGLGGTAPNSRTALATSTWYLVAVTKASGTSTPRFHIYDFAANRWTHEDGTGTGGDPNITTGYMLGCTGPSGAPVEFWNGDTALVGAWRAQLSDAQIETLPFALAAWFQLVPGGLWLLDQQATSQAVADLSGNGANQSSISGTTVSGNSVPIFGYGAALVAVDRRVVALSASASDAVAASESATRTLASPRAGADNAAVSEAPAGVLAASRAAADSTSLVDVGARSLSEGRAASDQVAPTSAAACNVVCGRAPTDAVGATDVARCAAGAGRAASDSASVSDLSAATHAAPRSGGDILDIGDRAARSTAVGRSAADGGSIDDLGTRSVSTPRDGLPEVLVVTQASSRQIALARAEGEGVTLGETSTATMAMGRGSSSGVTLSDLARSSPSVRVGATDAVTVSHGASTTLSWRRDVADELVLAGIATSKRPTTFVSARSGVLTTSGRGQLGVASRGRVRGQAPAGRVI